jgi:hypothetical protein
MMPSRTPEAQRLYWQKYRGERKPYAERAPQRLTEAGRAYLLGRLVEEQRREYGLAPARDAA